MPERTVRAAGGVLWRRVDGAVQVALVHRPKYDDWSLPKGKLEVGEPWVVGAVREVCEETGFVGLPGRTLGESRYRVLDRGREAPKTVRWWAMRALEGAFAPCAEVDALRWLSVQEAAALATSEYDDGPLSAFGQGPVDTTTVLLVGAGSVPAPVLTAYRPERVLALGGVEPPPEVRRLRQRVENVEGHLSDLLRVLAPAGATVVVCAPDEPAREPCVLSLAGDDVVDVQPLGGD